MKTASIEIGKTYSYTNKLNYTTRIVVLEVNEKSVFYNWASFAENGKIYRARTSRKQFEKFTKD